MHGGCYKSILLRPDADYALIGSVVTPAWNPNRARVGADQSFIDRYVGAADWATEAFLRELIGPNFGRQHDDGLENGNIIITLNAESEILWREMQLTLQQLRHMADIWQKETPRPKVIIRPAPDALAKGKLCDAVAPLTVHFE